MRKARSSVLLLAPLLGCVTTPGTDAPRQELRVEAKAFDPSGRETSGKALAAQVWGAASEALPTDLAATLLDPEGAKASAPQGGEAASRPAGTTSAPSGQGQDPERRRQEEALVRTQFGPNVVIGGDGRVTKQYFLSGEASSVFLALVAEPRPGAQAQAPVPTQVPPAGARFGGASAVTNSVLGRMLGEHEIELYFVPDFERMETTDIVSKVTGSNPRPPVGNANSLLLVTARPTALAAFESTLNLFYGSIPQIEIEVKVVEFNVTDSFSFGVTQTDANTPLIRRVGADRFIDSLTSSFPLNAPLLGGNSTLDRGTLVLGGVHDAWALSAKLLALEVNNKADIKSSPRMTVRNGGMASISTTTNYPFPQARIFSSGQNVTTNIDFKPVGITLNIRPVIAGTKVVILQIFADVSAVTGFAATDPVSTPIIVTRNAVTSVHVLEGQTTVIGGLLTQSTLDNESKVPLLGDIPVFGALFRSTTKSTTKTDLRFYITPRILEGPRGFRVEDRLPGG